MKLNIDIKNKKYNAEADVEKLIEKGMDNHEKDWKDKFSTKHEAKKEMLELKHKQKIETEEQREKKKTVLDKIIDYKKDKEVQKIEEQKRLEEEKKKQIKTKIIISIVLGVISLILMIVGIIFVNKNINSDDSAWGMLIFISMLIIFAIVGIWLDENSKKSRKK